MNDLDNEVFEKIIGPLGAGEVMYPSTEIEGLAQRFWEERIMDGNRKDIRQGMISFNTKDTGNDGFFIESVGQHNKRCTKFMNEFPDATGVLLGQCEECQGLFTNIEGLAARFIETKSHNKHNNPCLKTAGDDEEIFVLRSSDKTSPKMIFLWLAENIDWLNEDKVYQAVASALRMKKHHPRRNAT